MKRLLALCISQSPNGVLLFVLLSIILGTIEGLGIISLFPILSLSPIEGLPKTTIRPDWLQAVGITPEQPLSLITVLSIYLAWITLIAILRAIRDSIGAKLQYQIEKTLRDTLFQAVLAANPLTVSHLRQSDLTQLFTQHIVRSSFAVQVVLTLLAQIILLVAYTGVLMVLDIGLTLIAMSVAALLLLVAIPSRRKVQNLGEAMLLHIQQFTNTLDDTLRLIKPLKLAGKLEKKQSDLEKNTQKIYTEELKGNRQKIIHTVINQFMKGAALCGLIYSATEIFKLPGDQLLLMLLCMLRMLPSITLCINSYIKLVYVLPSLSKIQEKTQILNAQKEPETHPKTAKIHVKKALSLNNIHFAYPNGPVILSGASITINTGETHVITGQSGCGKSTLADILAAYLLPQQGTLKADNTLITSQNRADYQKHIAYMTQNETVFNGSLKNNLDLFLDAPLDEDHLKQLLKHFSLSKKIQTLPKGLSTHIDDIGQNLSGGEAQRLCLLRHCLRKKPILILDEPFRQIDTKARQKIIAYLESFRKELTLIIITHVADDIPWATQHSHLENGQLTPVETQ